MKSWLGWLMMGLLTTTCVTITWVQRSSEAKDRQAIESLVQDFYRALRKQDFETAAACYAPSVGTILAASGHALPEVLRSAAMLSAEGIPPIVELTALRFDEHHRDRAVAELVIPGPRQAGVGNYVMSDKQTGEELGIWARTLHFVKIGQDWKLSPESSNSMGVKAEKVIELLALLRDRGAAKRDSTACHASPMTD